MSCNRYPDCRYIHKPGAGPVETFGLCPQCQVGTVTSKTSRRGTTFYACDRYPGCDFATSTKPGPEGAVLSMARSGGARKPRKAGARKTTRTRKRA